MEKLRKTIGFKCAARGILYALKTQLNMRIHCLAALAALVLARVVKVSTLEFLWIILAIFFVLVTELLNTAVETVVNLVSPEYNPLAGVAKDVAAGAVLLSTLHSLVVAFFVFGRYVI